MEPVPFGEYTLLRRLAWGGMAELFLAEHRAPRRAGDLVVLKLIARRFAEDPAFVTMLQDEARIAMHLDHRNIGKVLAVGKVEGTPFLAMEYLHGKDMRAICRRSLDLRRGPVPVRIAVPIGVALCDALRHAHSATTPKGRPLGIIHRDVSPSNVMVTFDGDVKLVDFGIAKAANRLTMTQPGMIKGKLRYLSPEQVLGLVVDQRCDIFILGATLWECTVGRHLFAGQNEGVIYKAISEGRIELPSSLIPDYPPGLERILMRALARDRETRYPYAAELRADLVGFAQSAGIALQDATPLAQYVRALFAEEHEAWRQARAAGMSKRDHLVSMPERMVDEPLPSPELGPSQPPDISAEPSAAQEPTRKTHLFGEKVARSSDAEARSHVDAAGKVTLRSPAARSSTARKPSAPEPLVQVSDDIGHIVGGVPAFVEPAGSVRPTVIDPDQLPTRPRIDPEAAAQPETVPSAAAHSAPAQAEPAAPGPGGAPPPADGDLSGARTLPSLGTALPSPASLPTTSTQRDPTPPRRTKTGDWAHRLYSGKHAGRPGTHPYFDGDGPRSVAEDDLPDRVPHRFGSPKLLATVAAALLLVGGVSAWWTLRRPSTSPKTAPAPPKPTVAAIPATSPDAAPAMQADAASPIPPDAAPAALARSDASPALHVTSAPARAMVISSSGKILGRTPVHVSRDELQHGPIELRLAGFRSRRVRVRDDRAELHVKLSASATRRPPRRRQPPKGPPRPQTKHPPEILDPFSR